MESVFGATRFGVENTEIIAIWLQQSLSASSNKRLFAKIYILLDFSLRSSFITDSGESLILKSYQSGNCETDLLMNLCRPIKRVCVRVPVGRVVIDVSVEGSSTPDRPRLPKWRREIAVRLALMRPVVFFPCCILHTNRVCFWTVRDYPRGILE